MLEGVLHGWAKILTSRPRHGRAISAQAFSLQYVNYFNRLEIKGTVLDVFNFCLTLLGSTCGKNETMIFSSFRC